MIDRNSLSTEFVSAFAVLGAEGKEESLPLAGIANYFSCDLVAEDPAGP